MELILLNWISNQWQQEGKSNETISNFKFWKLSAQWVIFIFFFTLVVWCCHLIPYIQGLFVNNRPHRLGCCNFHLSLLFCSKPLMAWIQSQWRVMFLHTKYYIMPSVSWGDSRKMKNPNSFGLIWMKGLFAKNPILGPFLI
jgi:hypothetical protein